MKQKLSDFLCALVITMGILLCLALVAGTEFFDEAFLFDTERGTFSVFGTSMVINKDAFETADELFAFNDVLFGNGFSATLKSVAQAIAELTKDGGKIAFELAKGLVGAK